ncbi:MAG: trypsin-like peptidase domain-containing protein [Solirubrobacterales bacterium]
MIRRAQSFFRTSFGSAVIGGAVVGVFGWIAIAAGWIDSQSNAAPTVAAPLATPAASKSANTNVVNQIYRRDGQGVAFIQAEIPAKRTPSPFGSFGEEEKESGGTATGSGIVIDSAGHILTNNHVIAGSNHIQVKLGASNETYNATVVGTDPATDLALLKVNAPSGQLHPLSLGDSSKIEVGDPVVAIGNPFGLDRTVTSGIVSALQRQIQAPDGFSISNVIQTDAAINPGNSGGPLIEAGGNVIGINSQIETGGNGSDGNVGIGFAIPINTARSEISQLETSGKVQHAFLGITGTSITPDLARAVNLPVKEGVLVQEVLKNGPADKAGIQGGTTAATIDGANFSLGGDIITKINGKKISSMDEVVTLINAAKPGESIEVTVLRGGSTKTVKVTLGDRPASVHDSQSVPAGPLGK